MKCLNPILMIYSKENYLNDSKMLSFLFSSFGLVNNLDNNKTFINVNTFVDNFGNDKFISFVASVKNCGYQVMEVPCRKCVNCQLTKKREWSIRNTLELKSYDVNDCLFLTLTYNNEMIPYTEDNMSLSTLMYDDVQKFIKRLRKYFANRILKFFCACEYGDHTFRPHYHLLLYGLGMDDLKINGNTLTYYSFNKGHPLYTSSFLDSIWYRYDIMCHKNCNLGDVRVGQVTPASISYTSGYCAKKITSNYYVDLGMESMRSVMSRRPGIASKYATEHLEEIFKNDNFLYKTYNKILTLKPLDYFDNLYEKFDEQRFIAIKKNRMSNYDFMDWYDNLQKKNNQKFSTYMRNLNDLTRQQYLRKEVLK